MGQELCELCFRHRMVNLYGIHVPIPDNDLETACSFLENGEMIALKPDLVIFRARSLKVEDVADSQERARQT